MGMHVPASHTVFSGQGAPDEQSMAASSQVSTLQKSLTQS
jgi:hypothetical protein